MHIFEKIAKESNDTETNNALVSENSTPTCNADHEIFSNIEEASNSVNSSQQSTDTPPLLALNKASDIRVRSTSHYETVSRLLFFICKKWLAV